MKRPILLKVLVLNSKNKTYALIIVVLSIWGTIAYRISTGLQPTLSKASEQHMPEVFKPEKMMSPDTFSIKKIKRDPFLGINTALKKTKKKVNYKSSKKTVKNAPIMVYTGVIKAKKLRNQIFVLTINQKQCLLKKGQTFNGVTLVQGNDTKVVVRYKNKLQTIPRQ